jgi:hypothetical protein
MSNLAKNRGTICGDLSATCFLDNEFNIKLQVAKWTKWQRLISTTFIQWFKKNTLKTLDKHVNV